MGELGYDAAGAGEPALLFLHGWCGDRSFFAPQFDYFSQSHRVVSVDLPGHGTSAVPEEYAIDAFASDVAELAADLHLGRSVVFGHSIGAMVALALSQSAPELVGAVALIDPPPLSKEVWKGFAPQLIASFSGPDGPTGRRQFVEQMFLPTDDATRRAKIIETMTAVPNDIAIPLVQAIAAFDAMAVLQQCEVPVLTISSAVPTNDAASLACREPHDDARPDGRSRSLPAARGARASEPDDRAIPGHHPRRLARGAMTAAVRSAYLPLGPRDPTEPRDRTCATDHQPRPRRSGAVPGGRRTPRRGHSARAAADKPAQTEGQDVSASAVLISSVRVLVFSGWITCVISPSELMMYAVGVAATCHWFSATSFATRIVGIVRCNVLAAAAGVANPLGPLIPASIAAVTISLPEPNRGRRRLMRGRVLRQCGQLLSQNTTAVGLPSKDASVNVPVPVRFRPVVGGGWDPISVVGSGAEDRPGAGQLAPVDDWHELCATADGGATAITGAVMTKQTRTAVIQASAEPICLAVVLVSDGRTVMRVTSSWAW